MGLVEEFERVFHPRSVAVLGASGDEAKFGFHLLQSLLRGRFEGSIYPINPNLESVSGLEGYPNVESVPGNIDLAIVSLPNLAVPDALEGCARKGVKGVVIISAGFKESDDEAGADLQQRIASLANGAGMRIIGPNTFGMMNTHANLNACFTPYFSGVRKGPISIVSQSGGICHFLMPGLVEENIGLSKLVGLGNRANTDFPEMLEYLLQDATTRVIAVYMEGIDDPRAFLSVAGKAAGKKPIVVHKIGKGKTVRNAALSHTGSLAGRYELYDAGFSQAGIITTTSLVELYDAAKVLALQSPPAGNRIAVTSTVAGPVLIATDICEVDGLRMARFSPATQRRLNELVPPVVVRTNPVDWANSIEVIETVLRDENVDILLSLYVFAVCEPLFPLPSDELIRLARTYGKPMIVGARAPGNTWQARIRDMEESGIPVYPLPDRAARAAVALVKYGQALKRWETDQ